ncbi:MAG: ABC-type branched-chain amino acid transport system ATPase component [Pseudonocardiales bacterium]|nr:ABC-type branched-chain amino acid transport system ATPase component [Pseudonocardiales bacterium]
MTAVDASVGTTAAPAGAVVLSAEDVAVHYGGIKAVDGISISLTEGKIFGIVGPNGSGKSTLLGALTRMVNLTRGTMSFDGQEYHKIPAADVARHGVARTFQTVRLLPGLTVRENIMFGADLRAKGKAGRANAAKMVVEAIERTGLNGLEGVRPGELSYGMQRRVEIARAIATQPRLLLLDEPTAGMNQSEKREVSELLKKLRGEGLTQLLVEHDVQMMVDTCDYLYAMNFGVLIAEGKPTDVVQTDQVREAYLGKRWKKNA